MQNNSWVVFIWGEKSMPDAKSKWASQLPARERTTGQMKSKQRQPAVVRLMMTKRRSIYLDEFLDPPIMKARSRFSRGFVRAADDDVIDSRGKWRGAHGRKNVFGWISTYGMTRSKQRPKQMQIMNGFLANLKTPKTTHTHTRKHNAPFRNIHHYLHNTVCGDSANGC